MTFDLEMITFNCHDPNGLAKFWAAAAGVAVDGDYGDFVILAPLGEHRPRLGFQKVPEAKAGKNRLHLDFMVPDRDAEVARLVDLGSKPVGQHEMPGLVWTTLADPEGNEFDVAQEVAR